jgi:hypothetical protein
MSMKELKASFSPGDMTQREGNLILVVYDLGMFNEAGDK